MKKKNRGLTKVEIMFWDGMGECKPSTCNFRLEIVRNGMVDHFVGKPSTLRKRLKNLERWYAVKLPRVSWEAIVGDDNGGSLYKWSAQ